MEKLSLLWFALLGLERLAPDVAYIHEQSTKLVEGARGAGGRGIAGSVVYGSPTPSVAARKTLGVQSVPDRVAFEAPPGCDCHSTRG
jgi:hypothetical protein